MRLPEYPQSRWKAMSVERKREERWAKVIVKNGQLPLWMPPRVAHANHRDQFAPLNKSLFYNFVLQLFKVNIMQFYITGRWGLCPNNKLMHLNFISSECIIVIYGLRSSISVTFKVWKSVKKYQNYNHNLTKKSVGILFVDPPAIRPITHHPFPVGIYKVPIVW